MYLGNCKFLQYTPFESVGKQPSIKYFASLTVAVVTFNSFSKLFMTDELNAIDLAQAYQELIEIHELTHDQLSHTVHKSRAQITNTLRLLQLSDKARKALVEGKISAGHAKVIVALEEKEQSLIIDSIIGQKLSVRDVEHMAKSMKLPRETVMSAPRLINELNFDKLQNHLSQLGFKTSKKGSKFTIEFETNTQIDAFLATLSS